MTCGGCTDQDFKLPDGPNKQITEIWGERRRIAAAAADPLLFRVYSEISFGGV